jgi:hypothetical protein
VNTAAYAIEALLAVLADAGVEATRDPGTFFPQPLGVLVGLPTLSGGTLAGRSYEIPIYVVSGEPLTNADRVTELYDLADVVAGAVDASRYDPFDFRGSANAEPLPAVRITATASVPLPVPVPMMEG